jgi:hypothetical protein
MNADTLIYLVLNEAKALSPEALNAMARTAIESNHPGERKVFTKKLKDLGYDPHEILGIKKSSGGPSSSSPPPPRTDGKWSGKPINPESKDFRDRLHSRNEGNRTPDLVYYSGFHNLKLKNGRVLSIQASDIHHSEPRVDGLHPHQYTRWEVAVLGGLHEKPEFKKKFGHLVTNAPFAPHVSTEDVQKMVDHIESM